MSSSLTQVNHDKEAFMNGWVCGVYTGWSTAANYHNHRAKEFYRDSNIDHPNFVPPIGDAQSYETNLQQPEAEGPFRRGWVCGAARGGVPLQDIAAKTGVSGRDIQQIVIQQWSMIWRCGFSQLTIPDKSHFYPSMFEYDRSCSDHNEYSILSLVKVFLEGLYKRPFEELTDGEGRMMVRDIRCAITNGLDFGMLFAIARIKWVKKRCRQCKGRWALGNTTWMVPCISQRCESALEAYKCNCHKNGEFSAAESEATGDSAWSGIYQPTIENGTIRNATSVPPRRLWDVVTNRVVPFFGRVSALCQWCYDTVSFFITFSLYCSY